MEFAADFLRRVGLHVEGVELTNAAAGENEQHRPSPRAHRLRFSDRSSRQRGQPRQTADAQPFAARPTSFIAQKTQHGIMVPKQSTKSEERSTKNASFVL